MRYETNRAYVEREYPFIVYGEDAFALWEIAFNLRTGDSAPDFIPNKDNKPYTEVHKGWGGKWVIDHGYDTAVVTGHCQYIFGNIKLPCAFTDPWIERSRLLSGSAHKLMKYGKYNTAFSMLAKAAQEFNKGLRAFIEKDISEHEGLKARYEEWVNRKREPLTVEQLLSDKRVA